MASSCQHLAADVGYFLAKRLLKEQFGDEYQVAASYMEKALGWPLIKTEVAQGLYAYSLFLHACCNINNDTKQYENCGIAATFQAERTLERKRMCNGIKLA